MSNIWRDPSIQSNESPVINDRPFVVCHRRDVLDLNVDGLVLLVFYRELVGYDTCVRRRAHHSP